VTIKRYSANRRLKNNDWTQIFLMDIESMYADQNTKIREIMPISVPFLPTPADT
jgi:hypothetical protein